MNRFLLLLAALAQIASAWAQTISVPSAYAPVALTAACGLLNGPVCANIMPVLAAQTVHSGLVIEPIGGESPLSAICEGQAALAVVPRDAPAVACPNRYDIVGRPLYPVYAFLLVKADAPLWRLDDFREEGANEQPRVILTIGGSQTTLEALRTAYPPWRRIAALTVADIDTASRRIDAGTADGIFAVEPLDSGIVDIVRLKTDDKGKPLYRFAGIFPDRPLFRIGDGQGHCLYRAVGLDFGDGTPLTTISTNAVAILGRGFRDARAKGGPTAFDALTAAIDKTRDALLAVTKSPRDWRPNASSCQ